MRKYSVLIMTMAVLALAATGASAQSDMAFKGIGAEVGVVNPQDINATFGIGFLADLGTMTPQVGLQAFLDFWTKTQNEFGTEFRARDISVGARAKYFIPVKSSKFQPYAGGGLGFHFVSVQATTPTQDIGGFIIPGATASDTKTKLGLDIGGGTTARINDRTDFVGELWLGLVSDVSQLSARVGVVYKLGM